MFEYLLRLGVVLYWFTKPVVENKYDKSNFVYIVPQNYQQLFIANVVNRLIVVIRMHNAFILQVHCT